MAETNRVTPLIEAAEAFPAFEAAALDARREILFGMRLFEANLPLYGDRAKAAGFETWAELLAARAADGVDVRILLSDFEPTVATDLHRDAWVSIEGFNAAAEAAGADGQLAVIAGLHQGELGRIARALFWPAVRFRLGGVALKAESSGDLELEDRPGLWAYFRRRGRSLAYHKRARMRLWPATHHQKLAVFDGEKAIVGGIDLARRMYDTAAHDRPAADTWHDVSVLVEGPAAAAARAHLHAEWNANTPRFNARATRMGAPRGAFLKTVSPIPDPARPPAGPETTGFLRTRSRRSRSPFAFGPKPYVVEIEQALVESIAKAERLIYLETQFLRSPVIADALVGAARRLENGRLIVLLPAAPEDVAFNGNSNSDARHGEWLQAEAVAKVLRAWDDRAGVFALAQPRSVAKAPEHPRALLEKAPIVYIHAKVAIFDRAEAIVGSANLNGRSMRWDTETAVRWRDPEGVAVFLDRLWNIHFVEGAPGPQEDPLEAWRGRAASNFLSDPSDRKGFILPYDQERARAHGRRRFWIPTDML